MRSTLIGTVFLSSVCGATLGHAQPPPGEDMVGMYIHQHWPYNHPYAARTWTDDDWHGYLDALHKLGFNMVQIWPMLETVPNPPTPSDEANLAKIGRVIDMAHNEFNMKVWIVLCPNVAPIDEAAARVTFEKRHFFYTDRRVDPGDPEAMDALMAAREPILRPLAQMDGLSIIDSDPGGYAGSTNAEFVDLLVRHRKLLDTLRPGIELVYWMHAGWPAYARYYETGEFAMGVDAEFEEALALLKEANPEPWGLAGANMRIPQLEKVGLESRFLSFNYGSIEGEPTFPITNYGGDAAYEAGKRKSARGAMGNAQTHCVQLPNTFAFSRGAQGLPLTDADYTQFANDLIPGHGEAIHAGWKALGGGDPAAMREQARALRPLVDAELPQGPLKGLLFGDPNRFVKDLCLMLEARAAFVDFVRAAESGGDLKTIFPEFVRRIDRWQLTHGYENNWHWPGMLDALRKLDYPVLEEAEFPLGGHTPFDKLKSRYYAIESYTPRLIDAMRKAAYEMTAESDTSEP